MAPNHPNTNSNTNIDTQENNNNNNNTNNNVVINNSWVAAASSNKSNNKNSLMKRAVNKFKSGTSAKWMNIFNNSSPTKFNPNNNENENNYNIDGAAANGIDSLKSVNDDMIHNNNNNNNENNLIVSTEQQHKEKGNGVGVGSVGDAGAGPITGSTSFSVCSSFSISPSECSLSPTLSPLSTVKMRRKKNDEFNNDYDLNDDGIVEFPSLVETSILSPYNSSDEHDEFHDDMYLCNNNNNDDYDHYIRSSSQIDLLEEDEDCKEGEYYEKENEEYFICQQSSTTSLVGLQEQEQAKEEETQNKRKKQDDHVYFEEIETAINLLLMKKQQEKDQDQVVVEIEEEEEEEEQQQQPEIIGKVEIEQREEEPMKSSVDLTNQIPVIKYGLHYASQEILCEIFKFVDPQDILAFTSTSKHFLSYRDFLIESYLKEELDITLYPLKENEKRDAKFVLSLIQFTKPTTIPIHGVISQSSDKKTHISKYIDKKDIAFGSIKVCWKGIAFIPKRKKISEIKALDMKRRKRRRGRVERNDAENENENEEQIDGDADVGVDVGVDVDVDDNHNDEDDDDSDNDNNEEDGNYDYHSDEETNDNNSEDTDLEDLEDYEKKMRLNPPKPLPWRYILGWSTVLSSATKPKGEIKIVGRCPNDTAVSNIIISLATPQYLHCKMITFCESHARSMQGNFIFKTPKTKMIIA